MTAMAGPPSDLDLDDRRARRARGSRDAAAVGHALGAVDQELRRDRARRRPHGSISAIARHQPRLRTTPPTGHERPARRALRRRDRRPLRRRGPARPRRHGPRAARAPLGARQGVRAQADQERDRDEPARSASCSIARPGSPRRSPTTTSARSSTSVRTTSFGLFMVMELLEGQTVHAQAARTPAGCTPKVACDVMWQVADAVRFIHSRTILHGDIKTENIFLVRTPAQRRLVKLLDFGLARADLGRDDGIDGTPEYLAPERIDGAPASPGERHLRARHRVLRAAHRQAAVHRRDRQGRVARSTATTGARRRRSCSTSRSTSAPTRSSRARPRRIRRKRHPDVAVVPVRAAHADGHARHGSGGTRGAARSPPTPRASAASSITA